ncbi:MAG TPA: ABC transporter permease [Ktedonobacteraceae bacterium]|jgi:NitT/TauT family transport system permease protein|nr:ABC transporter permease [Ktedonobacteraceae bacterium]
MSITMQREKERGIATQTLPAVSPRSLPRARAGAPYRTPSRLLTVLPPLILGVVLLGLWYLSTARGLLPDYELPTLTSVWSALVSGLTSGLFLRMAWVTIQESLGGFLLALVIALPVGYGLAKWRLFAAAVHPYLAAGQAIPAIVIAPFLVFWMGYGMGPVVVLCFLVVLFPMVITTALGFQHIERSLVEAALVEGAPFWPMLVRIEFPLALPAIMAAFRTGLTLSIVGALVGEFVTGTDQGLGALVQIAKNQFNMPLMFATVIILACIAAIFYAFSWSLTKVSEAISM